MRRQLRAQQGRTSYLDDAAGFAVPVLLISGELDEICPRARQEELRAACPHAELVTVAAGHMAPSERPDQVAAALRVWLAR